jgi:hypothetical protein
VAAAGIAAAVGVVALVACLAMPTPAPAPTPAADSPTSTQRRPMASSHALKPAARVPRQQLGTPAAAAAGWSTAA